MLSRLLVLVRRQGNDTQSPAYPLRFRTHREASRVLFPIYLHRLVD